MAVRAEQASRTSPRSSLSPPHHTSGVAVGRAGSVAEELRAMRAQAELLNARRLTPSKSKPARNRAYEIPPSPLPGTAPAEGKGGEEEEEGGAHEHAASVSRAALGLSASADAVAKSAAGAAAALRGSRAMPLHAQQQAQTVASVLAAAAAQAEVAAAAAVAAKAPPPPPPPPPQQQPQQQAVVSAKPAKGSATARSAAGAVAAKPARPQSARPKSRAGRLAEAFVAHGDSVPSGVAAAAAAEAEQSAAEERRKLTPPAAALVAALAGADADAGVAHDASDEEGGRAANGRRLDTHPSNPAAHQPWAQPGERSLDHTFGHDDSTRMEPLSPSAAKGLAPRTEGDFEPPVPSASPNSLDIIDAYDELGLQELAKLTGGKLPAAAAEAPSSAAARVPWFSPVDGHTDKAHGCR
ncbi:hypothetical protein T492DRAFT_847804 [Pavlovales sp. CCMP2436]|nr:hypothetical protein T492DRAFT_847804 [Pavlovales sp. CCMP2436]